MKTALPLNQLPSKSQRRLRLRRNRRRFRARKIAVVWDVLTIVVCGPISLVAGLSNRSWIFGIAIAVTQLALFRCMGFMALATILRLPSGAQSELRALCKNTGATWAVGTVVASVQFLTDPQLNRVDGLNIALIAVIAIPLVTNAVRARHVVSDALRPNQADLKRSVVRKD